MPSIAAHARTFMRLQTRLHLFFKHLRRLLCASMRLRASAYSDIVEVLAEHAAQFEVLLLYF
jgi:hypothetical protein